MTKNLPEGRGRILVLSSTFPRWEGDTEPGFVFDLCRHLAAELEVTVLAPHAAGARLRETLAGVSVVRYRYGPSSWEKLAHGSDVTALRGGYRRRLRRWVPRSVDRRVG